MSNRHSQKTTFSDAAATEKIFGSVPEFEKATHIVVQFELARICFYRLLLVH